ncbi:MAG: UDP-N-acetylmuramate--L-alanine ligase [Candidatus Omnitrophota bacterium]
MVKRYNYFKRIHFVGIGGIGMSGIANILLADNKIISGSDLKYSQIIKSLEKLGANIYIGHSKDNIKDDIDVVVYSSAIKKDNPELIRARNLGIPVIKRAKMLACLMSDKIGITVTGSHGKTTTTSLISHILIEAGFKPTIAIGGILRNIDDNARTGASDYFVIEADESDGSFLYYNPRYAVITNLDYEHMDYYRNWGNLLNTYRKFVSRVKPDGSIYACGDDKNLYNFFNNYNYPVKFYGNSSYNQIYPTDVKLDKFSSQFKFNQEGKDFGVINLPLAGEHNILNALAATGFCLDLGIDFKTIANSIESFKGTERRFQRVLEKNDLTIIEDYGHHPTEIKAVLKAAKNLEHKRIIAIFQPHRYSRTKLLLNEFVRTFDLADLTIVTDIYAAQENPLRGITAKLLRNKIKDASSNDCIFLPKDKIAEFLFLNRKEGDLMLFLGAGDINKIAWQLAKKF